MRSRLSPELLALPAAIVFVVIGALGFVPGITKHHDQLHVWRTGSRAEIFGVFQTSVLLLAAYIAFGLLGIVWSRTPVGARLFLLSGAIGCFTLAVYGVAVQSRPSANVFPVNRGDNWLHAGLALGLVVLAWIAADLHLQSLAPAPAPDQVHGWPPPPPPP